MGGDRRCSQYHITLFPAATEKGRRSPALLVVAAVLVETDERADIDYPSLLILL